MGTINSSCDSLGDKYFAPSASGNCFDSSRTLDSFGIGDIGRCRSCQHHCFSDNHRTYSFHFSLKGCMKNNTKKQRLTLFMRPAIIKHAKAQAVVEELSLTALVEKALMKYLPKVTVIKGGE